MLTDPDLGGWPPERVTVMENPVDMSRVVLTLRRLARDTTEVLLIYYVGHGVLSERANLCLTLSDTDPEEPDVTGLEYDRLRNALINSQARIKVVILDCCYSGRAIEALSGVEGIADSTEIAGTYTLTASDLTAHVVAAELQKNKLTSFTGELLGLINEGIPDGPDRLTLELLYPRLRSRLEAQDLPKPNRRGTDTAGRFPFARNLANKTSGPPLPDESAPRFSSNGGTDERGNKRTSYGKWAGSAVGVAVVVGAVLAFVLQGGQSPGNAPGKKDSGTTSPTSTSGHPIVLSDPDSQGVRAVSFTKGGEYLAVGDANGHSYVWQLPGDTRVADMSDPATKGVNAVAFSPNGALLASGDGNGHVYLWAHTLVGQLSSPDGGGIDAVAFNPSGGLLAGGDTNGHTYIWTVETHKIAANLHNSACQGVRAVAFSFDNLYLAAAGSNGTSCVWKAHTYELNGILPDPAGKGVNSVEFSPNDAVLATGDANGNVYLWAQAHSQQLTDPASDGVNSIAFSSNSEYLAAADANGHAYIWDLATHEIVANLSDPDSKGVRAVAFAPNGKFVAAGDVNGNTYLLNLPHLDGLN
jgi:WD40 repeat protein